MKNTKKTVIILSSILFIMLVVLGIFLFKQHLDSKNLPAEEKIEVIEVIKIKKDALTDIEIKGADDTYKFQKRGESFVLTTKKEFRVKEYLGDLIDEALIRGITASSVIENVESVVKYGFDKPISTTTLALKDGKSRTIILGKMTPDEKSYYVMVDGSENVYVVERKNVPYFVGSTDVMWNDMIYTVGEYTDLSEFSLYKDGKLFYELYAQKQTEAEDNFYEWKAKYPLRTLVNIDNWASIIEYLVALRGSKLIDYNAKDLSKYGLDKPSYKYILRTKEGKVHNILIGNEYEGSVNYVYAKSAANDEVFAVLKKYLVFLNYDVLDVLVRGVYTNSLDDISNVKVKGSDIDMDLELDHIIGRTSAENSYTLNGEKHIGNSDKGKLLSAFFMKVILIEIDNFYEDTVKKSKYDLEISFDERQSKETVNYGYVKKNKDQYYVFLNDKYAGFTAKATTVDAVIEAAKEL